MTVVSGGGVCCGAATVIAALSRFCCSAVSVIAAGSKFCCGGVAVIAAGSKFCGVAVIAAGEAVVVVVSRDIELSREALGTTSADADVVSRDVA